MWRLLRYCLLKALLSLLSGGLIASSGLRHLFLLSYLFSFGGKTFMSCTKKMYWSLSCCFWYLAQCTDLRGVFHPFQGPSDVCKIAIWLAEAVHTTKRIQMKARSELGVDLCGFVISRLNWELHAWTQLFRDGFCCRHLCSVVRWGGTNASFFFFFGFFLFMGCGASALKPFSSYDLLCQALEVNCAIVCHIAAECRKNSFCAAVWRDV